SLAAEPQLLAFLDTGRHFDLELSAINTKTNGAAHRSGLKGNCGLGFHFARWLRPGSPSASAPSLAAENVLDAAPPTENIAEHLGRHLGIPLEFNPAARRAAAPMEATRPRSGPGICAGEPELIVLRSPLLVAQHIVGFLYFLEAGLRLLVAWIAVRM